MPAKASREAAKEPDAAYAVCAPQNAVALPAEGPTDNSFGINNVCLVGGRPQTLGLRDLLQVYLDHRISVVTRRSQYRLTRRQERLHLVLGLLNPDNFLGGALRLDVDGGRAAMQEKIGARYSMSWEQAAEGVITAQYVKEVDDPAWKDDPAMLEWRAFMARYYREVMARLTPENFVDKKPRAVIEDALAALRDKVRMARTTAPI